MLLILFVLYAVLSMMFIGTYVPIHKLFYERNSAFPKMMLFMFRNITHMFSATFIYENRVEELTTETRK
jgi:hypothetical protein